MNDTTWKICSICKRPIGFESEYFACSVSTCNRNRIALFFCSMACWDAHLPEARHRDAWAERQKAPTRQQWQKEREEAASTPDPDPEPEPARRRIVASPSEATDLPKDVLVVVSKLKAYVRARSGMNTSDTVTGPLSEHLRKLCDEAIRNAAREGRKTVMDRDFVF